MAVQQSSELFDLPIDAASVHRGTDVYSHDGEQLGSVAEVWAFVPPFGYVAKTRFALADYGPVRGTMHLLEGADGYLQVAQRRGIRRENERDLYIPLNAIRDTVPGEALILEHTAKSCLAEFGHRPECLDERR